MVNKYPNLLLIKKEKLKTSTCGIKLGFDKAGRNTVNIFHSLKFS